MHYYVFNTAYFEKTKQKNAFVLYLTRPNVSTSVQFGSMGPAVTKRTMSKVGEKTGSTSGLSAFSVNAALCLEAVP